MFFKKSVVLFLTVAVFACFGSPSVVVGGETIELTEVGIELATKAASLYAEAIYPDSNLGAAEPIYSLVPLDDTIVGWLFIINTLGEPSITFNEYDVIVARLHHKYYESLFTGDGKTELNSTSNFREEIQKYRGILISNYKEYQPLLWHFNGYLPSTKTEVARYTLEKDYELIPEVNLYSSPGQAYLATGFTTLDGSIIFSELNGNYYDFFFEEDLESISFVSIAPLVQDSLDRNVDVWEAIDDGFLSTEKPTGGDSYWWHLLPLNQGYYWNNMTDNWYEYIPTDDVPIYSSPPGEFMCQNYAAAGVIGYYDYLNIWGDIDLSEIDINETDPKSLNYGDAVANWLKDDNSARTFDGVGQSMENLMNSCLSLNEGYRVEYHSTVAADWNDYYNIFNFNTQALVYAFKWVSDSVDGHAVTALGYDYCTDHPWKTDSDDIVNHIIFADHALGTNMEFYHSEEDSLFDEGLMDDEHQIFEYRQNDMLIYLELVYDGGGDDDDDWYYDDGAHDEYNLVSSDQFSDSKQIVYWVPYLNFPVRGYTILSRDEAGKITQISSTIPYVDEAGWKSFETEAEGVLGVRYYPSENGEPVDVFTGEEVYFE